MQFTITRKSNTKLVICHSATHKLLAAERELFKGIFGMVRDFLVCLNLDWLNSRNRNTDYLSLHIVLFKKLRHFRTFGLYRQAVDHWIKLTSTYNVNKLSLMMRRDVVGCFNTSNDGKWIREWLCSNLWARDTVTRVNYFSIHYECCSRLFKWLNWVE